MSDIERLTEALQRLGDLRRRNRPNQRRIYSLKHASEARDVNIPLRATTTFGPRRSSLTPANETKLIRECRIVREVVYARTQKLLRQELSALQRDQTETPGPGGATNDELTSLTGDSPQNRESLVSDASQETHTKNLDWYFRKALVDASLRPTQKPLEEIDPCFCSGPYAIETANGECHEAVKMPRGVGRSSTGGMRFGGGLDVTRHSNTLNGEYETKLTRETSENFHSGEGQILIVVKYFF
ncbi:hypothetical protein BHYA_0222g00130 [Botrytis hyacinthi]|uniref:Uncharacterized protein n=1 Tax=Botrytis hyacinthi TaxID=278943 RepID=A0A4Z1GIS0_9HELO|nr:hypothetical protein BHYA_0222g00130 [Botrytis hyacinthi]